MKNENIITNETDMSVNSTIAQNEEKVSNETLTTYDNYGTINSADILVCFPL